MNYCEKIVLFAILAGFLSVGNACAQIHFGQYYSSSASVMHISNLEFGTIISGTPKKTKTIGLAGAATVEITGIEYLDVVVQIIADDYLVLNGNAAYQNESNRRIKFMLEAKYANLGTNNIGQARPVVINGNRATLQFPILRRTSGPPGPPPTPEHKGYNPPKETAYVYLYGAIKYGAEAAGSYSGQIRVTVYYY